MCDERDIYVEPPTGKKRKIYKLGEFPSSRKHVFIHEKNKRGDELWQKL